MSPRVVVVGSSNTDLVLTCGRLPNPGETVLGGEFRQFAGGKGANQAVAAARAGARVTFVGACGDDAYGRDARAALRREGIDLRHFGTKAAASGVALIILGGKKRENLIGVAHSANDLLSAGDVEAAAAEIARAGVVVCQLEVPVNAVSAAARLASEHQVPFILNPAPAGRLPRELLRAVSVLTPNEHEARSLAGCDDVLEAGKRLRKRGCDAVVITVGEAGALIVDGGSIREVRAPKVRVVDTVGAGDCFNGYLAAAIARGDSIDAAVHQAVAAASISVTRRGAQAGIPVAAELA
jgi:ribokinase